MTTATELSLLSSLPKQTAFKNKTTKGTVETRPDTADRAHAEADYDEATAFAFGSYFALRPATFPGKGVKLVLRCPRRPALYTA